MPADDPELRLCALVGLRSQEGFLGVGIFGIDRLNGGFACRPARAVDSAADVSARFRRDVAQMSARKDEIAARFG